MGIRLEKIPTPSTVDRLEIDDQSRIVRLKRILITVRHTNDVLSAEVNELRKALGKLDPYDENNLCVFCDNHKSMGHNPACYYVNNAYRPKKK